MEAVYFFIGETEWLKTSSTSRNVITFREDQNYKYRRGRIIHKIIGIQNAGIPGICTISFLLLNLWTKILVRFGMRNSVYLNE